MAAYYIELHIDFNEGFLATA